MTISLRALLATPLMLALVLTSAGSAFAQSASVGGSAGAGVGVSDVLNADTSANVDANGDTNGSDDSSDTSTDDSSNTGSNNSGANVQIDTSSGFRLNRSDSSVESATNARTLPSGVSTSNDLEAYAATMLKGSDHIESVDVGADSSVTVRYGEPAKLFGFIPFTMTSRVMVAKDGSVKVSRPWYSFLASGYSADASTEIASRVRAALASEDGASANGALSVRGQARVLAELASVIDGSVLVETQATGNVEADDSGMDSASDTGADTSTEGEAAN